MQRYTIFFIVVSALRVSGSFSAHHQELKNCTHSIWYVPGLLASSTSVVELERYTISFIPVNALHVSGGFSARRQELKNCTHSIGMCQACLLLPLGWLSWNGFNSTTLAVAASKAGTYQMLCVRFLSSGLHLAGYTYEFERTSHFQKKQIFHCFQ